MVKLITLRIENQEFFPRISRVSDASRRIAGRQDQHGLFRDDQGGHVVMEKIDDPLLRSVSSPVKNTRMGRRLIPEVREVATREIRSRETVKNRSG